ncbi:2,3-diaminopropionate biosynthesis protein SbnA [Paenibacillus sp. MMS20-IR301]|uniref:2,3-diaminopropionate biosynthesis protein SbnA n=1 Tax=Paenibacillus sp. MMS20-IR301 TaxID=2895946 RepID=UPI0028EEFDFE|nr:2,3-diaminopropionate biosynthesis protein SbnA [Paenibacillus sp. MMS20-IR301]WNS46002.1 2,3-diaminopropionate biosynthesis protein SbnA [Paenibacillus sp. MMS20-IR301]
MLLDNWRDKVHEVITNFPWYKELIGGEAMSYSLQSLPLLTSDILEAHYYSSTPDPALAVYRTSGTSTGRRKAIVYSEEDDRHYIAIKTKLFGELLAGSGCTRALADMGTGHAANTALAIFEQLGLVPDSIPFELPVEQHIERIQSFKPGLLYTMPSILDHIVHAAEDPRSFGIRKIILVGEIATLEWQKNMARLFGLAPQDITDTYGSIEMGTIAYYSHEHGRYIFVDGITAEAVGTADLSEGLQPLGTDERILVLTSTVRRLLPALRFVTYDVIRDFRSIMVNGVEKQSFGSIVKRVGRELKHGEKISIYDIEQVVYRQLEDAIIRVRVRDNALAVYIKSKSADPSVVPAIREAIRDCIPEIGLMIRNHLLDDIAVVLATEEETLEAGQVKNKKLYVQTSAAAGGAEPDFSGGILSAIGKTPLVKLNRLFQGSGFGVYAKLELLNPGGSAKDRPALRMIREAWKEGRIGPGTVIIESSSGNMAISLAMICQYLGLRFICVVDPRTTDTNLQILKAAGAVIDKVALPDPVTGEFLPARLLRVQALQAEIQGSYWPNQYANPDNYLSHYHTTMQEIIAELGRVDYLFCSVSTCGTIRGLAEYVKDNGLQTKIVAADAAGSAIFGGSQEKRRFPGLGAGIVPPFCRPDLMDHIVHVTDAEMVMSCRALARKEGILAGASSGAVLAAVRQMKHRIPHGAVCAAILHDKGERYLDTVYSDTWSDEQFGPEVRIGAEEFLS